MDLHVAIAYLRSQIHTLRQLALCGVTELYSQSELTVGVIYEAATVPDISGAMNSMGMEMSTYHPVEGCVVYLKLVRGPLFDEATAELKRRKFQFEQGVKSARKRMQQSAITFFGFEPIFKRMAWGKLERAVDFMSDVMREVLQDTMVPIVSHPNNTVTLVRHHVPEEFA